LDLYGPISFPQYSSSIFPVGANLTLSQLRSIKENSNVKGLLIRINSPGGTVGASQEIYESIKSIKQEMNIPVVAQIGDVGASGAYYAALGADTIFANPGSLVGSIGVIIGNISIYKLAEKHGVEFDAYKSGPYKDILSMWRPSTKEEEKLLQSVVDDVFSQFQKAFVESRKITQAEADRLAQGQIYSGLQALENNLIDKIGGYNDALQYIGELTGLGKNPTIISTYTNNWRDMVSILNNTFNMTLRNPIQTQIEVR